MKIINFKATPEFAKELDDHCKEWQITKSALIKGLLYIHIRKCEESQTHFTKMLYDYKWLKEQED